MPYQAPTGLRLLGAGNDPSAQRAHLTSGPRCGAELTNTQRNISGGKYSGGKILTFLPRGRNVHRVGKEHCAGLSHHAIAMQ